MAESRSHLVMLIVALAMGIASSRPQTDDYASGLPDSILIEQLNSPYSARRWTAASTLARRGNTSAVPMIVQAMEDSRGTVRTCVMAQALGDLGDTRAVPALMRALEHPANADLRVCAAEALGRLGDPRAVPALIRASRPNALGLFALDPLRRIGGDEVERFLQETVGDESHPFHRWIDAATPEMGE